MAAATKGKRKKVEEEVSVDMTGAPAWDGNVDEAQLLPEEDGGGGPLMAMISGRMLQLGHTRRQCAAALGISYGYLAQYLTAFRSPKYITPLLADSCAAYLGVPRALVIMAAKRLDPEEMTRPADEIPSFVARAIQFIGRDMVFGPLCPPELPLVSGDVQLLAVRLFEAARRCKLIPPTYSDEDILQKVKGKSLGFTTTAKKSAADDWESSSKGLLVDLIEDKLRANGEQRRDLAERLEISYGHFIHLFREYGNHAEMSDVMAKGLAEYLDVPLWHVYFAAGILQPSDLFPPTADVKSEVAAAINEMRQSQKWGHLVARSFGTHDSLNLRLFLIKLYEKAANEKLLVSEFQMTEIAPILEGLYSKAKKVK